MRALLLGWKGEFSSYGKTKNQFYRYTYEMYTRLKRNRFGIGIDKLEAISLSNLGKGPSMFSESLNKDFSNYDIIHSLDFSPVFPMRKGKSKLLTTVHDFQFALEPEINRFATSPLMFREMMFEKVVLPLSLKSALSSDYLIAVSTLTKRDAIRLGFDSKRIFVVNHGVDERFLRPVRKKKKGKFTLGTISAGGPRKNLPFSIRAFQSMHDQNVHFDIWGNITYNCEEFDLARKDSRISFRGFAPDDRIINIYDSFDAFAFPSLYEGFGIPIIEAQARGLPVIIYKKGKIPDETARYCIKARDEGHMAEIVLKIRDNGYSEKERKRAMSYARSFTWAKTADKTLDVYKRVIDRG